MLVQLTVRSQSPLLVGTTAWGGAHDSGVVFKIYGDGSGYTKLFDFNTQTGSYPLGNLVLANNGKLYGTAQYAGAHGGGTIFCLDTGTFSFSKLHDFSAIDGARPSGTLLPASDGKLYGTTWLGGTNNSGVLFSWEPFTNTFTKLFDFDTATGRLPVDALVEGPGKILYGVTEAGGANNGGTIFSFNLVTNSHILLHSFGAWNDTNGFNPKTGLILHSNGNLYGTTDDGGSAGKLFRFDISTNTFANVLDFADVGGFRGRGIAETSNGRIYGYTIEGGSNYTLCCGSHPTQSFDGMMFCYNPSTGVSSKVYDFTNTDGKNPGARPMFASDGRLYATAGGGANSVGVVFQFNPITYGYTDIHDFSQSTGIAPMGNLYELRKNQTGIAANNDTESIRAYPNPSNGIFYVHADNPAIVVTVTNSLGELVFQETSKTKTLIVDLTGNPCGLYFLTTNSGTRVKLMVE
jgi:uncharacterized repeat protein (TIGR03803 family)